MITKTSLENFDMIFKKSGNKFVDFFPGPFAPKRDSCVLYWGEDDWDVDWS